MRSKSLLLATVFLYPFLHNAQAQATHSLEKMWETDTTIKVPESVLYDRDRKTLFVSLIDGQAWDPDGKGGIAKMSLDGTTVDQSWVTGLNCPKGMATNGNKMYVADYNQVVVINIKKGTIEKKIDVPGAVNLNDVTTSPKGVVYVSDSKLGKVYMIDDDKPSVYLDSMPRANGLKYIRDLLFVASGKNLVRVDSKKDILKIAELPEEGDGVELTREGDYLVTSWIGYMYYITPGGVVTTMLDTHNIGKNTADIGYDPYENMVYMPTFYGKTVVAYKLK